MKKVAQFFDYAQQRHAITLRRAAGMPREEWTDDPILRQYRFTCVFRELDKTTAWFRKFVRDPMRSKPEVLLATVVFRLLNRIEVGEAMFNQLDIEHANIRAVLAWSRQHNVKLGLKLCGSIWRFWEWHNFIGEGRAWLETFIAQSPPPTAARGKALRAASAFAVYQGDYEAARVYMEEALPIFQQLGDKRGIATALNELGVVALGRGRFADARQLLEQSLAIKRELGDDWLIANSVGNLGLIAGYQNDYAAAYTLHQESLAISRALNEMGGMAIESGNLGHAAMHLGKLEEAQARQGESLKLFEEVGDKDGLTECLERFAMLANANANFRRAAQLFGAASVLRKETGTSLMPAERAEYDSELSATRAQLDVATFEAAWAEGQAMTLEQAIACALK